MNILPNGDGRTQIGQNSGCAGVPVSVAAWLGAAQSGSSAEVARWLAPGVVLRSPVTDRFSFVGPGEVLTLLDGVFALGEGYRVTHVSGQGERWACLVSGTFAGVEFDEAQSVLLDSEGLVAEVTLMVRPLAAVTAMAHHLGPLAARMRGQDGLARRLRRGTRVLHGLAGSGDRRMVAAIRPPR